MALKHLPISNFYLFPEITVCPPGNSYDPTQPTKNWVDPSAASMMPWSSKVYPAALPQPDGSFILGPLTVPAPVAAKLNAHDNIQVDKTGGQVYPMPLDASKIPVGAKLVIGYDGWIPGAPPAFEVVIPDAFVDPYPGQTDSQVLRNLAKKMEV